MTAMKPANADHPMRLIVSMPGNDAKLCSLVEEDNRDDQLDRCSHGNVCIHDTRSKLTGVVLLSESPQVQALTAHDLHNLSQISAGRVLAVLLLLCVFGRGTAEVGPLQSLLIDISDDLCSNSAA